MNKTKSIEDTYKYYLNKKNMFREFVKEDELYIATNNFYVSDEVDDGRLEFNNNIEKIKPYNNIYMELYNDNNLFKNYINLVLISNISFNLDEININKFDIIKKFIDSDIEIEEKILEDFYYNNVFSKKINKELPNNFNNKIIMEGMNNKYLFKINIDELYKNIYYENNNIHYNLI
jgi:hypothetical protein